MLFPFPTKPFWTRTFKTAQDDDAGDLNMMSLRVLLPASSFSTSGTQIRIGLRAPLISGHTGNISNVFFGQKAASGNAYSFASSTPPRITFNGASSLVLAGGAPSNIYSDAISLTFDRTKDYVLSIDMAAVSGNYCSRVSNAAAANSWYKNSAGGASGEAGTATVSGYTADANSSYYFINEIQVH